jgi:hypothetical protein
MGGDGGAASTRRQWCRGSWFAKCEAGGGLGQKPPNELPWLGLGLGPGSKRRWGVMWAYRPPCRGNLGGRGLAVSLYSGGGLVLLTLGPISPCTSPSPLLPFLHSPSAPIPLPGAHGWVRYSPTGLAFGADRVEDDVTNDYAWLVVWWSLKFRSILIILFILM